MDIGAAGERKQTRRRGFPTKKAAQAELTRILGALEQRQYVAPKRQTVAQFLTDTWLPAIEQTIKPATFESYRRNVRLHVAGRPVGRRQLQQLDPADLNALYGQLLAGGTEHRPLSARSVAYIATILHRAFRDAIRWQALVRNPCESADPPRPSAKPEMKTWTAAQLSVFLQHVSTDRLSGGWWLAARTGMRRGEVLGLRWSDVDLDAGRLTITRTLITTDVQRKGQPGMAWGTPKTAKGRRQIAIDPGTVTALRSHRARQLEERLALGAGYADEDLVVCRVDGTRLHPKLFSDYFAKEARNAGLPVIRLHDLRHTHATLALRAGVHPRIVQERLGHANISITLDTYSHVDLDMQAAAAAQIAALVSGGAVVSWLATVGVPIGTLVLGYVGSLYTEAMRDKRASERAKTDRDAQADAKRREWRETFELDSLRQAHTSLSDLSRAVARHHHADMLAAHRTGSYGYEQVDDELSQTLLAANRKVYEVVGLVLDDHLRDLIRQAHEALNQPGAHRGDAKEADSLMGVSVLTANAAQDALSARIREIYKSSVTTS